MGLKEIHNVHGPTRSIEARRQEITERNWSMMENKKKNKKKNDRTIIIHPSRAVYIIYERGEGGGGEIIIRGKKIGETKREREREYRIRRLHYIVQTCPLSDLIRRLPSKPAITHARARVSRTRTGGIICVRVCTCVCVRMRVYACMYVHEITNYRYA